jgi:hypothetical protein
MDELRIDTIVRTDAEILDWYYCDAAFKDQYSFSNRDSTTRVDETGGVLTESVTLTDWGATEIAVTVTNSHVVATEGTSVKHFILGIEL